jgi:transposase
MVRQVPLSDVDNLALHSERLGPLPLINHFIRRLDLEALLDRYVPTKDRRVRLPYAKALGVLLRSVLIEREPIYRQQELVSGFSPECFMLDDKDVRHVGDDAVGRALDRLFDADRASLLTEAVVAAQKRFALSFDELHNDSTTIRFCGQYRQARGRTIRGKQAPFITWGHSKDHRPDLKQLLFIMTTTSDGSVPIQFRCAGGNVSDVTTHEQTWESLCRAVGRRDFLYVADSKLCSREALHWIDRRGGRLVCVLPRNRHEDGEFREWIQTHVPAWELVRDRPHPRRKGGPRDRWWVYRHDIPSVEGWPVIWVYSSLLALRQERRRRERIAAAKQALEDYNARLTGPRPRKRSRKEIYDDIEAILSRHNVGRYLRVRVIREEKHDYRQTKRGRPGADTRYIRTSRVYFRLAWELDEKALAYDNRSDGMYPLLTNDRSLSPAQVLEAHKRQPSIEKRFEQTKAVFEIAPVLLKNEGRVEALFFVYFLAQLVQSLIEREIRLAMKRRGLSSLPLYPEERKSSRPTAEQIFRLFSLMQRNILSYEDNVVRVFDPVLTDLQQQVLELLGVPETVYRA